MHYSPSPEHIHLIAHPADVLQVVLSADLHQHRLASRQAVVQELSP